MPKYNTEVEYELKENETYTIITADEITTRTGLFGVRVVFQSKNLLDKRVYSKTLWPVENARATSPWGAFVSALGNNTDDWPLQQIRVITNQARLFEIALVTNKKNNKKEVI